MLGDAGIHPRVVHTHLGIFDRKRRIVDPAERLAWPGCIAVDQEADQIEHIFLGPPQPVLKCQEIGTYILGGSRNESQQFRHTAKHLHLRRPPAGCLVLVAAQALEQGCETTGGLAHVELAQTRVAHHLGGRHRADNCVAGLPAGFDCGKNREEVVLHEQHGDHDDVGPGDVVQTCGKGLRVGRPLRCCMHGQPQAGQLTHQPRIRSRRCRCQMRIHGQNRDPDRRIPTAKLSGCSGLWHRKESRW